MKTEIQQVLSLTDPDNPKKIWEVSQNGEWVATFKNKEDANLWQDLISEDLQEIE